MRGAEMTTVHCKDLRTSHDYIEHRAPEPDLTPSLSPLPPQRWQVPGRPDAERGFLSVEKFWEERCEE